MTYYILWGKDENGRNASQRGLYMPTRSGDWDHAKGFVSLDELLESPTFDETQILEVPAKTTHSKFDRARVRSDLKDDPLLESFELLWDRIDRLDLEIETSDFLTKGKPIRESLRSQFSPEDLLITEARVESLTPSQVLQMRHSLIQLRTDQYVLRDSYVSTPHPSEGNPLGEWDTEPQHLADYFNVEPLNTPAPGPLKSLAPLLFPRNSARQPLWPRPSSFNASALATLRRDWIGRRRDSTRTTIDLREPTTWHSLITYTLGPSVFAVDAPVFTYEQMDQFVNSPLHLELSSLKDTARTGYKVFTTMCDYYLELASQSLSSTQRTILALKLHHVSGEQIRTYMELSNEKVYEVNYIYTIFCKQILTTIADTVKLHYSSILQLDDPASWKTCIDCGRTLIRSEDLWPRNKRVKDGLECRCRSCNRRKKSGIHTPIPYKEDRPNENEN